jgi:hypothetical protein
VSKEEGLLVGKTFFKEKVYINQLVSRTGKLPPLLLSLPLVLHKSSGSYKEVEEILFVI